MFDTRAALVRSISQSFDFLKNETQKKNQFQMYSRNQRCDRDNTEEVKGGTSRKELNKNTELTGKLQRSSNTQRSEIPFL